MNFEDFRRILRTFGTAPESVDTDRGTFALQIGDELVSGVAKLRQGELVVLESQDAVAVSASHWIMNRLARLRSLADSILQYTPPIPYFVVPKGSLLDSLENAPTDETVEVRDALATITNVLDRRPAGATSLLYLTSDAGEGKTTLIGQLARQQASLFREGKSDWLVVPIALGGRPFLRLDEVVTAALVNHFRFRALFWESFLELVRLGVLVPALDGFEELFFEDAEGEAVSSLCSLLERLSGGGTLLIAARKAYFEFRRIEAASAIVDRMKQGSVTASRLALLRWSRDQFVRYAELRGKSDGAVVFDALASTLGSDHPALARPVLAQRVLTLSDEEGDIRALVASLRQNPEAYFATLVKSILEREANSKWIDRVGDPAGPLLSVQDHHELLAFIATEMWTGGSESLGLDVLEVAADLFCETRAKSTSVAHQVRERVRQHALLVASRTIPNRIEFDHQEFFHYFLGIGVALALTDQSSAPLRAILRRGSLPVLTIESAIACLKSRSFDRKQAIERLQSSSTHEGSRSYSEENLGALIMMAITPTSTEALLVTRATFPVDSLMGRRLESVTFEGCVFRPTSFIGLTASGVRFRDCDFERLDLDEGQTLAGVEFANCRVATLAIDDVVTREPRRIESSLARLGAVIPGPNVSTSPVAPSSMDEDLKLALRATRAFTRLTEINENTWRARLGRSASRFFEELLPKLVSHGIVSEVEYHGHGVQRRFKLGVPLGSLFERGANQGETFAGLLETFRRA
jgi:hypothetical protein